MNILAIDQARVGAWSVFEYESKKLIGYGTFSFDAKKYTYAKAILHIEELISIIIPAYDISAVFIEDINLRRNVQAFKRLAQLQGVLVNLFERNEYLYDYIVPSQWQSYCEARGRTSKEVEENVLQSKGAKNDGKSKSKVLSIEFVRNQFGIETENDNLADAICIGWYAVNTIEIQAACNKTEKSKKN